VLEQSARPKSDLYHDLLPLINANRIELLDNRRLAAQLIGLERRISRQGKDSIDHPPGGHDDLANAAAGLRAEDIWCGLRLSRVERRVPICWNLNFLKPPVSAAREFDGARRAKSGSRLGERPLEGLGPPALIALEGTSHARGSGSRTG
jgi:hypothetical protein